MRRRRRTKKETINGIVDFTFRYRSTFDVNSVTNVTSKYTKEQPILTKTIIETKCLNNLPYFDPANPATLKITDSVAGSFGRTIYCKGVYCKVTVVNNNVIPGNIECVFWKVKSDTSNSFSTYWESGITDVGSSLALDSPLLKWYDSPQVMDMMNVVKVRQYYLQPGEKRTLRFRLGSFVYENALSDVHAFEYQTRYRGCGVSFRACGSLAKEAGTPNDRDWETP